MSGLNGNPEDEFSHVMAQLSAVEIAHLCFFPVRITYHIVLVHLLHHELADDKHLLIPKPGIISSILGNLFKLYHYNQKWDHSNGVNVKYLWFVPVWISLHIVLVHLLHHELAVDELVSIPQPGIITSVLGDHLHHHLG